MTEGFIWSSEELKSSFVDLNMKPEYRDLIKINIDPVSLEIVSIYSFNTILNLSQMGGITKLTKIENGNILNRYGGKIVSQSNSEVVVKFKDGTFDVFSFSDFTETYSKTNMGDLVDELLNRGFLK